MHMDAPLCPTPPFAEDRSRLPMRGFSTWGVRNIRPASFATALGTPPHTIVQDSLAPSGGSAAGGHPAGGHHKTVEERNVKFRHPRPRRGDQKARKRQFRHENQSFGPLNGFCSLLRVPPHRRSQGILSLRARKTTQPGPAARWGTSWAFEGVQVTSVTCKSGFFSVDGACVSNSPPRSPTLSRRFEDPWIGAGGA
jgi:hypothetical protein